MSIDHAYAELGLPVGASESQVKAAWRRLVSRWHPDRNPSADAVDLMQRINRAYEQIRLSGFGELPPGAPAESEAAAPARPRSAADDEPRARTLRRKVRLTLEEAALGCTRVLRGRLMHTCAVCAGRGVLKLRTRCGQCAGAGTVRRSAWYGWVSTHSACEPCEGTGSVPRTCDACAGEGKVAAGYRRTVRLPAGVRHGDVLSAEPSGEASDGFEGTLEIHVDVAAHPFFQADDDGTLRCEMPVDGFAWVAEAWVDVPTLTGLHRMRLRRGRQQYRLRGQGVPRERRSAERGDYLVTVVPTFPDTLSARQLALLEQLAAGAGSGALHTWRRTLDAWDRGRARSAEDAA